GIAWDEIWSRNFPEEMWTGAITPLMFSWRCWGLNQCHSVGVHAFGYPELDYTTRRLWIYHKGASYYNCKADLDLIKTAVPPPLRAAMLEKIPKAWHEEALNAPFDWGRYLESFQRIENNRPDIGYNWWKAIRDDYIESDEYRAKTRPRTQDELRAMSDEKLKQHLAALIRIEVGSYDPPWNGLLYYMRDALGWMGWIITNWYDGDRANVFMDLVTGTRNPTVTTEDNYSVWALAEAIRTTPELRSLFDKYPDTRFLDHLDRCRNGVEFQAIYAKHITERGHRGHADRDIYFTRRAEGPMVDIQLLKALMGTPDPRIQERKMAAKLEETIQHVYDNLAKQEWGIFKAQLFKVLCDFAHHSIEYRDNEREVMDWSTFAIKRGFLEVSCRICEKGLFDSDRDFYFLTMEELYDVLDGKANMALTKAKIAARMKNFDKVNTKEIHPSHYLQCGLPADIDAPTVQGKGVMRGKTTSVGKVTGTARVVRELAHIGRVQKGEILIVHATDPGWTPVFMVITGIVLETGGLISHGALLAREYGLPGVQIPGALELIPDGATITLDGDAGMVIIHEDEPGDMEKAA
ncbi:MAG: PEP-utilizing enzyme, partial [Candidatus Binatia bacterium]